MKTLHLIRSPESEGRPEKYIADSIVQLFTSIAPFKISNYYYKSDAPEQGAQFYDNTSVVNSLASCVPTVVSHLKDGDAIFFIDAFSPLVSSLDYYIGLRGWDVKMFGIFHSSCYAPGDLFENSRRMKAYERYLLNVLTTAFVGSPYLRNRMVGGASEPGRIVVSGLPMPKEFKAPKRIDRERPHIIWSHRWADDKRKNDFLAFAKHWSKDYKFIILTPVELSKAAKEEIIDAKITIVVCKTKDEYKEQLATGDVIYSCALLETFGYSVLEGIAEGLMPFVPAEASYEDLISSEGTYLFNGSPITAKGLKWKIDNWNRMIDDGQAEIPLTNLAQEYLHWGAEMYMYAQVARNWNYR